MKVINVLPFLASPPLQAHSGQGPYFVAVINSAGALAIKQDTANACKT